MGKWICFIFCMVIAGCSFNTSGINPLAVDASGVIFEQSIGDHLHLTDPDAFPDGRSSPDGNSFCNPATCSGCCEGAECITENSQTSCGLKGIHCLNCAPQKVCNQGQCVPCSTNDQCPEDKICLQAGETKACTSAYGHKYRITIVSAKIRKLKSDDTPWNPTGGATQYPEPYVVVRYDKSIVTNTPHEKETLTPNWKWSFEIVINKNSTLVFYVMYPYVISVEGMIGLVDFTPEVPISVLKSGKFSFTPPDDKYGLQGLELTFEPL